MKKSIFTLILLSAFAVSGMAQKYALVDTEYILSHIPSYISAQDQLDKLSEKYQEEVQALYEEVEKLYKDFQAERVLLSEEMKRKKEDEIIRKEKEAKELQQKYFGPEGNLFQKREELMKPIQDEVYKAIKEIALAGNYAVVFDTSSGTSMIYSDPKYDKSDEVLERLGYKI